jgi:hypothetical protein
MKKITIGDATHRSISALALLMHLFLGSMNLAALLGLLSISPTRLLFFLRSGLSLGCGWARWWLLCFWRLILQGNFSAQVS